MPRLPVADGPVAHAFAALPEEGEADFYVDEAWAELLEGLEGEEDPFFFGLSLLARKQDVCRYTQAFLDDETGEMRALVYLSAGDRAPLLVANHTLHLPGRGLSAMPRLFKGRN